jgi:hypothetical protein
MKLSPQQSLAMITALAVLSYTALPHPATAAEHHVVSLSELQQEMNSFAKTRAKDLEDIERVLSLPAAQDTLAKARLNTASVKMAIASLDDQELTRLAKMAREAEQDVQGGFIVGLLALIGLIVVIIIVVAVVKD